VCRGADQSFLTRLIAFETVDCPDEQETCPSSPYVLSTPDPTAATRGYRPAIIAQPPDHVLEEIIMLYK
jgi:hypothetical protein